MDKKLCPFLPAPTRPLMQRLAVWLGGDTDITLLRTCLGHDCEQYINVRGIDPQTGELMDSWGCAIRWMPTLQIETSQQARQTGAAVESFRNATLEQNERGQQMLVAALNPKNIKLIEE